MRTAAGSDPGGGFPHRPLFLQLLLQQSESDPQPLSFKPRQPPGVGEGGEGLGVEGLGGVGLVGGLLAHVYAGESTSFTAELGISPMGPTFIQFMAPLSSCCKT